MIFLNKKGGEKLLSIWWIFALAVIGAGVVLSVLAYHSVGIDIREVEANIIYEKIVSCVIKQGFLIDELTEKDFDVFEKCQLNKEIFGEGSDFYFNIQIFNETDYLMKEVEGGDFSFEKDCEIQEGEEGVTAKYYPKCVREREVALYYKDNKIEEVTLEILAASNQAGRKVSVVR